jgi:uncharacterized protein YggT (Ycf19 family)
MAIRREEYQERTTHYDEAGDPVIAPRVIHEDVTDRDTRFSVVYYILNIVEALLLIRLVLKLLGANPAAGFSNAIYTITNPLVSPFAGIFRQPVVSGSTVEWSTIIAMIVYALIAYAIVQLFRIASRRTYTV